MLAVMSNKPENSDLPTGWKVEEYSKTGRGKIYAVFEHRDLDREVHIVPFKSYGIPGFTNCHRITLAKGDSIEVVAEGHEVEHADEAEEAAIEVIEEN